MIFFLFYYGDTDIQVDCEKHIFRQNEGLSKSRREDLSSTVVNDQYKLGNEEIKTKNVICDISRGHE